MSALASSGEPHGPPDTAYFEPRSVIIPSNVFIRYKDTRDRSALAETSCPDDMLSSEYLNSMEPREGLLMILRRDIHEMARRRASITGSV